ncbi:8224_t:CDS:2, partial [Scutellospora calospora]
ISCQSNDQSICGKIVQAFLDAGSILSSTLLLKSSIFVNISVYDFCGDDPTCSGENFYNPGYAQPTLLYLLKDNDGVERLYPQSLVKQFNFSNNPEYKHPDIYGEFNLALDYWFKDDPSPIKYNQYDFLGIILHELCHGLGFLTSWSIWSNDESSQYITPMLITEEDYEYIWEDNYDPSVKISWRGFREYIFDKYLVFTNTGDYVSNQTTLLNEFFNNNGDIYGNYDDFHQKFISSPQYNIAVTMLNISIQSQTLGLVNWNLTSHHGKPFNISDLFVVDTTSNPFDPYNSINHVDYNMYTNTSDFLMRYQLPPGETLSADIRLAGKTPNSYLTNAIELAPVSSGISLVPSYLIIQHVIGLLLINAYL